MSEAGPARKKRIPKACGACRVSKVKCDGLRPCSRCRSLRKVCEFVERPKDPYESKMEAMEKEIEALKAQLHTPSDTLPSPSSWPGMSLGSTSDTIHRQRSDEPNFSGHYAPMSQMRLDQHRPYSAGLPPEHSPFQPSPSTTASTGAVAGVAVPIPESARLAPPLEVPPVAATSAPQKRSRAHFEAGTPPATPDLDPITAGLMTPEIAESYFATFFSGCDRYVPVFDPRHDTFESVRRRSTLLFSAICSVGCRVLGGAESHQSRLLAVHTQRLLNVAIAGGGNTGSGSLESIQALLVRACYAPERSLLVAVATRMALEMGLPEAYGVLSARCVTNNNSRSRDVVSTGTSSSSSSKHPDEDDGATLMRKTRTWLHLLIIGQILHVDAGAAPGFRFRGAAQRCRILLDSPHATDIDLHLFSQVELNALRTRIHSTLTRHIRSSTHPRNTTTEHEPDAEADEEILALVADAQLDLRVWHDDWARISSTTNTSTTTTTNHHPSTSAPAPVPGVGDINTRMPWLAPSLAVQHCWAESMAACAAVRAAGRGEEDVRAMSPAQRSILLTARRALRRHLDVVLAEPRVYLRSMRYGMDFMWAKNAFCYLLLLKLSVLLPEEEGDGGQVGGEGEQGGGMGEELVEKGRELVDELSRAGGGVVGGGNQREGTGAGTASPRSSNTSSLYLNLVRASIEKFSKAMRMRRSRGNSGAVDAAQPPAHIGQGSSSAGHQGGWSVPGAETQSELESFVPEQFVFEWDFPGLTFFASPTHETGWLDELLGGAFDGPDNFYGMAWTSMDLNLV